MRPRVAFVVSLALHVGLAIVLASLRSTPPPRDPPEPRLTDVILIDEVPATTSVDTERGDPGDAADRAQPERPPSRDEDDPPSDDAPRPERPRAAAPSARAAGAPTDDDPVRAPADPAPVEGDPRDAEADPEGALALSGLRDRGPDARGAGSLRPRYAPGSSPAPAAGRGRGAAVLPSADTVIDTPADAGFVQDRDGRWIFHDPDPAASWTAELLADGRLRFEDRLAPRFDANGGGLKMPGLKELAPAAQGAQFWLRRKRRLLEATRAMRLQMAVDFARKNIGRQLRRLHRDLLAIWTSDAPPHTRRGRLFDLWDDCDEHIDVRLPGFDEEGSELDALRTSAGEQARAQVLAFIQRHLPASSADAYTTAELTALNARRLSEARFDPYATG